MKPDTLFKRAFNDALKLIAQLDEGGRLPSEKALSEQLRVSRTTVRKVIAAMAVHGVIRGCGRHRSVGSVDKALQRFPEAETVPMAAQVEKRFMEWILRENASPGTAINELELARQFGVATSGIREFLNRFQHFGLIEKRPNGGWLFQGFTTRFALELFEIREMFELRSATAFGALPESSPLWLQIEALREEHLLLQSEIDQRYYDFRPRQPLPPPDQPGRAEPLHRRLLRYHHVDLPLSLPMESA
jgi:DNA-binding GntR family transcriptional regulator